MERDVLGSFGSRMAKGACTAALERASCRLYRLFPTAAFEFLGVDADAGRAFVREDAPAPVSQHIQPVAYAAQFRQAPARRSRPAVPGGSAHAGTAHPGDVAQAVAFYASEDNAFMTGTTAAVNGGMSM